MSDNYKSPVKYGDPFHIPTPASKPPATTVADAVSADNYDHPYPHPEYLQLIQFEGSTVGVIDPEDYESLYNFARQSERDLTAAQLEIDRLKAEVAARYTVEEVVAFCELTEDQLGCVQSSDIRDDLAKFIANLRKEKGT